MVAVAQLVEHFSVEIVHRELGLHILLGMTLWNNMPIKKCKICKKEFYAKPSHIERGWSKYCGKKCQYIGQMTGKTIICKTCGKKVYKSDCEVRHSQSKNFFCNKSCSAIWKNRFTFFGENHPSWKNGEGSYRKIILRSKKPIVCGMCGIKNIRVLLTHHIDGDRKNNKIKNLRWLCRNCHYLIHKGKTI